MKKMIACAGALMLATPVAQADMIGVYAGIQGWFPSVDGGYDAKGSFTTTSDDFSLDRADNISAYVKFEHPVPVIPNVMARYTSYETTGNNDESVDMTSTDLVIYYEILDFDVGSLDLGFSVKQLDGKLTGSSLTNKELSTYLPMLYAAISTEVPFTGVSAFGSIDYIGYDGSAISDWKIGVGYAFIDNIALDLTAQIAYRSTTLKIDDIDSIDGKLEYEGVFVGLEAHF